MKEQKVVYDGEFIVISTENLREFNKEFINHTKQRFDEYKQLFGVNELRKLGFVLFDDLNEYRDDYRNRCKREPPSYSRGNFSINTAYISVDQPLIPGTEYFYKKRGSGAHEAFHIYYRDLIYRKNNDKRIVWFDEGMAQYFSGQREHMDFKQFARYYSNFRKNYKPITNLNERIQGNSQISDDKIFSREGIIDGYPLSYLAIRYLIETKGINYIREIMRDNNRILKLGKTIIDDFINYYDERLIENQPDR